MITHGPGHDELEWQAQERALAEARGGVPSSSEDTAVAQYREIANALRQPPVAALPADFAGRVARIAGEPVREPGFEQALMRVLVVAFALSALVALVIYGGRLLPMLQSVAGAGGLRWVLGIAACLGLSWSLDWMQRQARQGGGGPRRTA